MCSLQLLTRVPSNTHTIFAPSPDKHKDIFEKKYEEIKSYFDMLETTKDILERLGHLDIIGITNYEELVTKDLQELQKEVENCSKNEHCQQYFKEKLVVSQEHFQNYLQWLMKNSATISPNTLRHAILDHQFTDQDLLSLATYYASIKGNSSKQQNTFEFIITTLWHSNRLEDLQTLILTIINNTTSYDISQKTLSILTQLEEHSTKLQYLNSFNELIENNYLAETRQLKSSLEEDYWHYQSIEVIAQLNKITKNQFHSLLAIEKTNILNESKELLNLGYQALEDNQEGLLLNIDEAIHFIQELPQNLQKEYLGNIDTLLLFTKISNWIHNGYQLYQDTINNNSTDNHNQQANILTFPDEQPLKEQVSRPLIAINQQASFSELESQIESRIQYITNQLKKIAQTENHKLIELTYTSLQITTDELEAFLPPKPLAENYLEIKYYNAVRKIVAIIAEIQETFGYINEQEIEINNNIHRLIEHWLEKLQTIETTLIPIIQDTKHQTLIEIHLKFLAILHRLQNNHQYYSSLINKSQEKFFS